MSLTSVGIYEFNAKDLIGHGAFAVVYKGRLKSVSEPFLLSIFLCAHESPSFIHGNCMCETKSGIDRVPSCLLCRVHCRRFCDSPELVPVPSMISN